MSLGVPENPIDVSFREGIGAVCLFFFFVARNWGWGHQPWILRLLSAEEGRIRPFLGVLY